MPAVGKLEWYVLPPFAVFSISCISLIGLEIKLDITWESSASR